MKILHILALGILCLFVPPLQGQSPFVCNFRGDASPPRNFNHVSLNLPLQARLKQMMNDLFILRGIPIQNSYIQFLAGEVSNATAYYHPTTRVHRIVYSIDFLELMMNKYGEWAVYGVLAHELAHHSLNHHNRNGNSHQMELEADYMAGTILCALGAPRSTIPNVLARTYAEATPTHPARATRIRRMQQGHDANRCGGPPPPPSNSPSPK